MIKCSLRGDRTPTEYPDEDHQADDFQILLHHVEQVAFCRTLTDLRFGHPNPTESVVRRRWRRRHFGARGLERRAVRQILASSSLHPGEYLQREETDAGR